MNVIRTDRLDLIPAPADFIESLVANEYLRAGDILKVTIPDGWPEDDGARRPPFPPENYPKQSRRTSLAHSPHRIALEPNCNRLDQSEGAAGRGRNGGDRLWRQP